MIRKKRFAIEPAVEINLILYTTNLRRIVPLKGWLDNTNAHFNLLKNTHKILGVGETGVSETFKDNLGVGGREGRERDQLKERERERKREKSTEKDLKKKFYWEMI